MRNVTELPKVFWTWGIRLRLVLSFFVENKFHGFEKGKDIQNRQLAY